MRRYAFIDVQNTASTTQTMLGFIIDWVKLCDFLKNKKLLIKIARVNLANFIVAFFTFLAVLIPWIIQVAQFLYFDGFEKQAGF